MPPEKDIDTATPTEVVDETAAPAEAEPEAPADTAAVPEQPPLTNDAGDLDYEELLAEEPADLDVESVEEEEPVQAEADGEAETPQEDSAAAPSAEKTAEPKVEATKPAPEETLPDVSAAAEPEQQPEVSMKELEAQYLENRKQVEADVASTVYALNEEQIQKMDEGDSTVISQLMAKVYMDAVTGSVAHMLTRLPGLVEQTLQAREQSGQLEQRFYGAWPALDAQKHSADVERFGQVYRQLNPTATPDDFIRDVGAQLMVALKLSPTNGGGGGNGTGAVAGAVTDAPPAKPYIPAKSGSGGGRPAQTNPFEQLAEEMLADDM